MKDYIERLIRCGYSAHEAYQTVYSMLKDFGSYGLEEYISSLERDCYGVG